MRAVRLHRYHEDPSIDEIPEPQITGPLDVLRRARLTRLGMEANGDLCTTFLETRYADPAGTG
jgi:hypothetical protein